MIFLPQKNYSCNVHYAGVGDKVLLHKYKQHRPTWRISPKTGLTYSSDALVSSTLNQKHVPENYL